MSLPGFEPGISDQVHLVIHSYELSYQAIAEQMHIENELDDGMVLYEGGTPDDEEGMRVQRSGSQGTNRFMNLFSKGKCSRSRVLLVMVSWEMCWS